MKLLHLECASGISGDMWLGALIDAGASLEAVQSAVEAMGVGNVRITMGRVRRAGLQATSVRVRAPEETPPVRRWEQIRNILDFAALDEQVRGDALAVFERLALAEADVHGVTPDEIEFHEVGALDTIADVVGTCAALRNLAPDRITVGTIAVGTGRVDTMHGTIPIPGPAVTALLRGFVVEGAGIEAELATPTGAALLAEFAEPVSSLPAMALERVGLGAGAADLDHPNVLRAFIGHAADAAATAPSRSADTDAAIVEATVDDLSPELVPVVLDRLREAGAHDAWATPVLMKKGRPGYTLTALCDPNQVEPLRAVLYRESTTIGTRWYPVVKEALQREIVEVSVAGETVRVKVARRDGAVVNVAPEFSDTEAVARTLGRPVREVYAEAAAAAHRHLDGRA